MKPGAVILVCLLLALAGIPATPAPEGWEKDASPSLPAATPADSGYWGQMGHGGPVRHGMHGLSYGNGPGPRTGKGPFSPPGCHGRGRPANSCLREELRRDPVDMSSQVRVFRVRGYRRLSKKTILNNEKRQLIYSTILMNPGIDLLSLSYITGINLNTMRYHVSHLERNGTIASVEHGGEHHYFENHGRFSHRDQQQILFHGSPRSHQILTLVSTHPGITRGDIAGHLGLSGPSVTRWMQRLIGEGIVEEVREGRCARYYPATPSPTGPLQT